MSQSTGFNVFTQSRQEVIKIISVISIISTICSTAPSQAQEIPIEAGSAYSFGGACASQGQWTRTALSAGKEIGRIITQLKNDENCKGLATKLQELVNLTESTYGQGTEAQVMSDQLTNIPKEIQALRSFVSSTPSEKKNVFTLLMDRSVKGAMLAADAASSTLATSRGSLLMSLGERTKRLGETGINIIESVANELPNIDQCLATPDVQGQLLAGTVQMLAAFTSSGANFSNRIALAISRVASALREQKYSSLIRRVNEQQLEASISCLIETTTEAYCSARDARYLYQKQKEAYEKRKNASNPYKNKVPNHINNPDIDNPFEGYYLLLHQVPLITKWLQRIQIGVDPRLETDAIFKMSVLDDINNHLKKVNATIGLFNRGKENLSLRDTKEAKQNEVLNLLEKLTAEINDSRGITTNFFHISKQPSLIPFFLVDVNEVPEIVTGAKTGYSQGWEKYMLDGGKFGTIPGFANPDLLIGRIEENLQTLINEANVNATTFFSKWFVVDTPLLISESVFGFRYTVKQSLKQIDSYLSRLTLRLKKYNAEPELIPVIYDTQTRIRRVLEAYEEVANLNELKPPFSVEESLQVIKVYKSVVDEVYNQFNIILQRSGFITDRMNQFVYADYATMLKNKIDLTPFEEELFYATGQGVVDRMLQLFSGNHLDMELDITNALYENKRNLSLVEDLVKGYLINQMSFLKMVVDGKQPGNWRTKFETLRRLQRDVLMPVDMQIPENASLFTKTKTFLKGILFGKTQNMIEDPVKGTIAKYNPTFAMFYSVYLSYKYSDRYPLALSDATKRTVSPDDEFGSAKVMLAKYCIQSLAFNDWRAFKPYCEGTQLKSNENNLRPTVVDYNTTLRARLNDATVEEQKRVALNHSERICAFRDWRRKAYVEWHTALLNE